MWAVFIDSNYSNQSLLSLLQIFQLKILRWKLNLLFWFWCDFFNSDKKQKLIFSTSNLMWFPLDKSYFKRLKFSDILYINSPQKRRQSKTLAIEMLVLSALFLDLLV